MVLNRVVTATALAVGGYLLSKQISKHERVGGGIAVRESIDVDLPCAAAYDQWTHFEEFPRFMPDIKQVRRLDDHRLHWSASIDGREHEWDADITEQVPERRIAWRSSSGIDLRGAVRFAPLSKRRSRITLQLEYRPEDGAAHDGQSGKAADGGARREALRDKLRGQVRRSLQGFKDMVEAIGAAGGAWSGKITEH